MDLKIINNIDNNIFSSTILFEAYGSELLSSDEEMELIKNFPVNIAYRNLKFTRNVKINGTVPVITNDELNGSSIVSVTLPPLSNKEILIDENFMAHYKIDYKKIPISTLDENVLTTQSLVAQAYCLIFSEVICKAVKDQLDEIRAKAPGFESETVVSV